MALIGNHSVLNKSHAFFTNGTSTAGAYAATAKSNWTNPSYFSQRRFSIAPKTSFTEGHNLSDAYLGPWKSGGLAGQVIEGSSSISATAISARLSESSLLGEATLTAGLAVLTPGASSLLGEATLTASAAAVSALASSISGAATLAGNLSALVPLASALLGESSVSGNLKGVGRLEADIDIGAGTELSPENLASAVWTAVAADNNDVGTMGEKLNDAGSAGNPWAAEIAANNDAGTFGAFVQKLLTVAKFIGLK